MKPVRRGRRARRRASGLAITTVADLLLEHEGLLPGVVLEVARAAGGGGAGVDHEGDACGRVASVGSSSRDHQLGVAALGALGGEGDARRGGRLVGGVEARGAACSRGLGLRTAARLGLLEGEGEGLVLARRPEPPARAAGGAGPRRAARAGCTGASPRRLRPGCRATRCRRCAEALASVTLLSLTCRPCSLPASSMVKPAAPDCSRACCALTPARARLEPAGGVRAEKHLGPASSSTKRVPASGPPRTVSDAFFSAITLFRLHPQDRMRLISSRKF